jgi:hypothetical protein
VPDQAAILQKIQSLFVTGNDLVIAFNQYLATQFGKTFQVAVDWVLLGLILIFCLRIFKFSFDVLRYVLVPSVVVSGLVAVSTSLSFLYVMPLAMGAGTIFMLFKS